MRSDANSSFSGHCHGFGHDTDEMYVDIPLSTTSRPSTAPLAQKRQTNAQVYHTANNRNQIKKLHIQFPEIFDTVHREEHHNQTILDLEIMAQSDKQ